MKNKLSKEQFLKVLPKRVNNQINDKLIKNINKIIGSDPILKQTYRDNLLSYTNVMTNGSYKLQSYLDAVRYVSFKLHGDSNAIAYTKTFPDRYQKLVNKGATPQNVAAYVAAYNNNKLVNLVFEQTLVPVYILNAEIYQKAINTQAELMANAHSEKVRTDAANSLLNHLKRPEVQKVEIDVGMKEDKTIKELRDSTMELVAQQRKMIEANAMTAEEVAHSKLKLVEGESEVVDVN